MIKEIILLKQSTALRTKQKCIDHHCKGKSVGSRVLATSEIWSHEIWFKFCSEATEMKKKLFTNLKTILLIYML